MEKKAVQDIFAPNGTCFGCGPKNEKGLQIKSYWEGEHLVLRYKPKKHHAAFRGVLNGGIIATLLDCHMNWCAATTLHKNNPNQEFPSTVTAELQVQYKRPTPLDAEIFIKAWPVKIDGNKVVVEAELIAAGQVTAKGRGTFAAVSEGHPAYHRWD